MPQGFYVLKPRGWQRKGRVLKKFFQTGRVKRSDEGLFHGRWPYTFAEGRRLSSSQAIIGSLLSITESVIWKKRLLFHFEKVRTRKKALKRIATFSAKMYSKRCHSSWSLCKKIGEKEAVEWLFRLKAIYPSVMFSVSYFDPVIGQPSCRRVNGSWLNDKIWCKKWGQVKMAPVILNLSPLNLSLLRRRRGECCWRTFIQKSPRFSAELQLLLSGRSLLTTKSPTLKKLSTSISHYVMSKKLQELWANRKP